MRYVTEAQVLIATYQQRSALQILQWVREAEERLDIF